MVLNVILIFIALLQSVLYGYALVCVCYFLSHVRLFVTPWTVVHQLPLNMGFSRREY